MEQKAISKPLWACFNSGGEFAHGCFQNQQLESNKQATLGLVQQWKRIRTRLLSESTPRVQSGIMAMCQTFAFCHKRHPGVSRHTVLCAMHFPPSGSRVRKLRKQLFDRISQLCDYIGKKRTTEEQRLDYLGTTKVFYPYQGSLCIP